MSRADSRSAEPSISVIVPVLNERDRLPEQLQRLRAAGFDEILVVDGGSDDGTVAIASSAPGVIVLTAPRGRGPQLDAGARAASGDVLLFVHADVELPDHARGEIVRALADPEVVAGAFRTWTVVDRRMPSGQWLGPLLHLADLRSRISGLPYGDQAMFTRREAYVAAGGFPDVPILEDIGLARRLAQLGRIEIADASVRVSGRRFQKRPLFYTTLVNLFPLLHRFGVSAHTLHRWYEDVR